MDYKEQGLSAIEVITDVARSNKTIESAIEFYVTSGNRYSRMGNDKLIETIDFLRNRIADNDEDESTFIPDSATYSILSYAAERVAKERGLKYDSSPESDIDFISESNAERILNAMIDADPLLEIAVNELYISDVKSVRNDTDEGVIETIEYTRKMASDEKLSESRYGKNAIIGQNATTKLMLSAAENAAREIGLTL